MTLSNSQQALA